ncbi:2Fe-2S iron-sulfur cluster-binding protein [Microvirga yunnanensis]|uniref:2Fe-2S iron-sulfur cluster-binding protein n=1 Tax=Microvirga yunnanensis TaxID=2953740 RepID=UPI0021C56AEF|nr:2Fe-2S iron-sulfur cluster-binding protein [Microvirga sp. HBU65207]
MIPDPAETSFSNYKIVAKRRESETIMSLELAPACGSAIRPFIPGQFIIVRLPDPDGAGTLLRHYSISSSPSLTQSLRISVKREMPPPHLPDVPEGAGSSYLHKAEVGTVLSVHGPRGEFCLDRTSPRPVLLLSGGVGLTPLVSMLDELAHGTERRVFFVHACENGRVHALRDEVLTFASSRPGITTHFCYRVPTDADEDARVYDSKGLITRETLQTLLPLDDYDIYLCGPTGFMQANYALLRSLGIPKHRIHYEFFGPATVLVTDDERPVTAKTIIREAPPLPTLGPVGQDDHAGVTVSFNGSAAPIPWPDDARSLLDLAESVGLEPPFSCRAGVCSTCTSRLISGEVEYFEEPLTHPGPGELLLCCSRPRTSVTIAFPGRN